MTASCLRFLIAVIQIIFGAALGVGVFLAVSFTAMVIKHL
jgi:hypothetical protein